MFYLLTATFIMFILNNHPLTMGLLLMLTSVFYATIVAFSSTSSWLAYMLILVFLSGLMIMIMYMTSLASNENMKIDWKTMMLIFLTSTVTFLTVKMKIKKSAIDLENFFESTPFMLIYKTYNKMLSEMSLILIIYLLVVLIVAMKIISLKKGPLKMNK